MRKENPLFVSVVMITYNHENYISEAIEGVLMQECAFDFELIIADDLSPDNTMYKVNEILAKSNKAKRVKYIKHEKNKGIIPNFVWALEQCKAKYIALCEGDDYWTDPHKLQKQVDFLENNTNHSLCFHSSFIKNQNSSNLYPEKAAENMDYAADDLLLSKVAHTASFVFRNNLLNMLDFSNKSIFGGDVFLALMLADKGLVYGMKDYMSVYRIHEMGITSVESSKGIVHQKRFIKQYIFFRKNIESLSKKASAIKIADHSITVALFYLKRKNIKALKYLFIAVYYRPELLWKGASKLFK